VVPSVEPGVNGVIVWTGGDLADGLAGRRGRASGGSSERLGRADHEPRRSTR
jgi:hypothetical protein